MLRPVGVEEGVSLLREGDRQLVAGGHLLDGAEKAAGPPDELADGEDPPAMGVVDVQRARAAVEAIGEGPFGFEEVAREIEDWFENGFAAREGDRPEDLLKTLEFCGLGPREPCYKGAHRFMVPRSGSPGQPHDIGRRFAHPAHLGWNSSRTAPAAALPCLAAISPPMEWTGSRRAQSLEIAGRPPFGSGPAPAYRNSGLRVRAMRSRAASRGSLPP